MAQLPAPMLTGDNYGIWKVKMETLLLSQDLWDIVEGGYTTYPDGHALTDDQKVKLKEDKMKDARALFLIQQGVAENIFSRIISATKSKEAWNMLQQEFKGSAKVQVVKLQTLRRQFQNLQMRDSEKVKRYFTEVMDLVNQMRSLGDTDITEQKIVEKMLISLPESFDSIVTAIEESKDLTTLPIQQLISSLEAHEERKLQRNMSNENAFKASSEFRIDNYRKKERQQKPETDGKGESSKANWWCEICKKNSHDTKYCWSTKQCNKCKKKGHIARFCRTKLHNQPETQPPPAQANFTEEKENTETIFYASHSASEEEGDVWYLDSGCTNHMTSNHQIFHEINTSIETKVRLGNGAFVQAKGKGNVAVQTKKGLRLIKDVLLVPDLKQNLLSVGQLVQNGYAVHFESNGCKIFDQHGQVLANIGMENNNNFTLQLNHSSHVVLQTEIIDESVLWHKRFGHLNYRALKLLQTKNMVQGLPEINSESKICEGCILGKQHRNSFPKKGAWRAKSPLELIHTDICGKMQTPSEGKNWYFLIFVDDFTRMTWVYFLKEKSQALEVFKKFKALVENQSNSRIKVLRSDKGGEYTSNQFVKFCEEHGIRRQLTTAYTPQQNGVAERKNRTIVEMARAMLKDKSMPLKFWAEAVSLAVYIQNRSPTIAVPNKTPIEAWSGRTPDIGHLKIFGSVCYAHVPKEKRSKLDDKSERCIFMGYMDGTKGYRLYNLEKEKLVGSRDVIFDEKEVHNWENKQVPVCQQVPYIIFQNLGVQDNSNAATESHTTQPTYSENPSSSSGTQPDENQQLDATNSQSTPSRNSSSGSAEQPGDNPLPNAFNSDSPEANSRQSDSELESTSRRVKTLAEIYERCNFSVVEPQTFQQAQHQENWREAMEQEIRMIEKNNTWELVDRPADRSVIGVKWIYKTKLNPDGTVQKYKARLVAKGFKQKPGIDYFETYAPVARLETIRTIIAFAAQQRWRIFQLDVKSAFLNGELEEEIFVEQPEGFLAKGGENKVYKLKKALYGLKQAPRAWYSQIDNYFLQNEFEKSKSEPTLYVKKRGTSVLIIALYVDDLIYTSNDEEMMMIFKEDMMNTYEMSDLGLMKYFLGIEVFQAEEGIFISQRKYAESILKKNRLQDCKSVTTPLVPTEKFKKEDGSAKADPTEYRSLVGSLLYLTATRPDIMFSSSLLSRYMDCPTRVHFTAAKRVLRYIKGTIAYGIWFRPVENSKLVGYTDSDWAGCQDDMKSTSGYAFSLGSGICSWSSKKQTVVALSSAEAEYVAAARAVAQSIWLKRILEDINNKMEEPVTIYSDSKSAIAISENPISHDRTKHIAIKYHYTRDAVEKQEVQLKFCRTDEQFADIFTKVLTKEKFEINRENIGVSQKESFYR